jgi:L-threonylcarbamoyladenylate synthase
MQELVRKTIEILKKGGLIVYPTDTVWGIGCDATNEEAVEKIYALKKRPTSKSMICLVSDFKMLNRYVEDIPEVAYDILKYANKPTTIVYERPLAVAPNLIADDNTLAFRVVKEGFAHDVIKKLKRPIVSTSANVSSQKTPAHFSEISQTILNGVDYTVPLQDKNTTQKPSSIIKILNNGQVEILR